MDRNANSEQQRAIDARTPLITVSAGAGTGKTWTLSSRYISLLKEGVGLENILTLTFTEKAAQEMRERIEGMTRADSSLGDAVSRFDEAYISTLHSFASRTLRESGLSLDIDPASGIIAQPQIDEFRGRFARELDENEFPEFNEILSEFSPEKISELAGECENVHAAMGRTPDDFLSMCGDVEMKKTLGSLGEIFASCARETWEAWHKVLDGVREQILTKSNEKKPSDYVINFASFIKKWDGVKFSDENASIFFAELFGKILSNLRWGGKFPGEIAYFLGESAKDWRDARKHFLQISKNLDLDKLKENCAQELSEREALMRVCAFGWRKFEDMRRRSALLSFTDLIRFAAESKHSKKFAQIMIDEFQDTDPLQEKMVRSFAHPGGSVFVVGDPKQSIYRFREADLSIFDRYVAESRERENLYINMNQSFRMRSSLYERVNSLFGRIWRENLGRKFPHLKYEKLVGVENKLRESETVPAWGAILEDKLEPIDESRTALLEKLTDTLKNFKNLTIWDEAEQNVRPLEWRDCAILTPTRTSWTLIEEIFSGAGVPLVVESGTSWFSHGEVSDLINMLRALAFPEDELANEGWKRSIFAPRDEDNANSLREIAQIKGASGAIAYFIDNLGWLKNLRTTRRNRALANVRHAARLVGEYERGIYKSLPGCAEWLALALKNDKKIEEPRISTEENAVKLLTVHSSKGLEFPLVVLFGVEKPPRRGSRNSLIVSKHLGVLSSKHEILKNFHSALEDEADVEEWQRLFYVATTRAKDAVIFCGIKDAEKSSPRGSWLEYLEKAGELDALRALAPSPPSPSPAATPPPEGEALALPLGELSAKLTERGGSSLMRFSATSFALYDWCPLAWRRRYRQGLRLDWESPAGLGSDVGSIVHWLLAKWDFEALELSPAMTLQFPPRLRGAFRELLSNKKNLATVQSWFENLRTAPAICELKSKNLMREVVFKVSLGKLRLVGAIDLCWEDAEGFHIRDWKTNPDASEAVEKMHESQLLFYGTAMKKLGKKISSLGILSVRDGANRLFEADLDGVEEKITQSARDAVRENWKPKTQNCETCLWRNNCGV